MIVKKRRYWAVIGYVPGHVWYIALERRGPIAMLFPRFRVIPDDAVEAVKQVLVRSADNSRSSVAFSSRFL